MDHPDKPSTCVQKSISLKNSLIGALYLLRHIFASVDYPERPDLAVSGLSLDHAIGRGVHQLADSPDMVRHAKLHRWRHPQGFVDAAQVVVGDIEADSRRVVVELL